MVKIARLIRMIVLLAAAFVAMAATGGPAFAQFVASNVTITPNNGPLGGGTAITISGDHFTDGHNGPAVVSVKVGGTSIGFTVINNQTITATTPAKSAGGQTVEVIFNGNACLLGFFCEETGTFTYISSATVTSVTPNSGTTLGGTSVFITGSSFSTMTSVSFGGVAAANAIAINDSTIQATTPAHAAGAVDVTIVNAGGTGTGTGVYTYVLPPAPTITNITPNTGSTNGGTGVTITGTNLGGATAVTFGGNSAGFTITDGSHISATTPPGTLGAVDVVVTTPSGTVTSTGGYTYTTPPPVVSAIGPNNGPVSGGTSVTITGNYFTGATAVTIGGTPVTTFSVLNATTITATTAAHAAGTVDVTVTTATGTGTGTGLYTYGTPPPSITSISPIAGTTTGGTSVTITGAFFTGATSVTFGGSAAAFVVNNDNSITATTPAHAAGAVDVTVTTPPGTGTGFGLFTYVPPPPTVTSVLPASGPTTGGTAITITGQRFTGAVQVKIGGFAATGITVVNDSTITATTPAGAAGAADVVVIAPLGQGTGAGLFTYVTPPGGATPAPTVTGILPASGSTAGGTAVTITGTDFVVGASNVTIGGSPATNVTVVSTTTITATTPAHAAGAADVAVTTPNGTGTGVALYTYTAAAPSASAISPTSGSTLGGTSVTITGANFVAGSTSVTFDGIAATGVNVVSSTSLTAMSPAHAAGAVNVVVTTPGGASGALSFTYVSSAPTVTAVSPNTGPTTGGTAVTITGTNLSGATAVLFGGNNAQSFTIVSATQITATSPAHSLGSVNVQVVTPSGTSAASAATQFTYAVPEDSQKLRSLQTGVTPLVAQVSGQAFTSAVDGAVAAGFSGSPQMLTQNGSGFTYYFNGDPGEQAGGASDNGVRDFVAAPDRAANRIDDGFSALAYKRTRPVARPVAVAPSRDWLGWVDFRGTDAVRHGSANDVHGPQINFIAGLSRRLTPDFLVGILGGYEYFDYSSDALSGRLKGDGWTIGTYVGWRLGSGLRFDAALGYSDIGYDGSAGTASGNFSGTRWLASGGLTGTYAWRTLIFEPSARLYGLWENEDAYTDSLGTVQAERKFSTGRASGGSKVIFPGVAMLNGAVTPYVGIFGDYYFTSDDASATALASSNLLQGWSARATAGVGMKFDHGMQVDLGGEAGGLGSDTTLWGLRMSGRVSF